MSNHTQKNVLIIQRHMTKYRVPLFELLRKNLSEVGVTLHVANGSPYPEEAVKKDTGKLPWSVIVPSRYFNINKTQLVFQPIHKNLLLKQNLIIIAQENRLLFNYWLLLHRYFSNLKLAFWGHGDNFQATRKNRLREKMRSWTAIQVDWWFAYTSLSVEKVISTGFPENRITCLNNAIDTGELLKLRKSIPLSVVEALKQKMGLSGDNMGVFIGSLYEEKRLDFLFEAADELRRYLPDFELLIIGDGPLGGLVNTQANKRSWTHWVGTKHGSEKALYLSLGKVMLNPGLVGLNILDSFAMGLPMVTTDCGIHSPEIAYLKSGYNGFIVDNNIKAFVKGVISLFTNHTVHDSMAAACEKSAKRYSLRQMVENFSNGILKALEIDKQ